MTKKQFDAKFNDLLKTLKKDLKAKAHQLFYSGGVDPAAYENDYRLPKTILVVALYDEAENFGLTDDMKKNIKNLRHF